MKKMERKSHEEWCQLIAEQAESGQSVTEFCGQRGLSLNRFVFHRRRKQRDERGGSGFREIKLNALPGVQILLGGSNCRIEVLPGFNAQLLKEVVEALQ